MAEIGRVSIRLPSSIRQGEVIRVRAFVAHPMEVAQRDKQGTLIRKNYNFIHTVAVTYNGKEVMGGETTQAVSQNPSFSFPLKVSQPGTLTVSFLDTMGKKYEGSTQIRF